MAKTFTAIVRFLVPRWLYAGDGGKVLTAITTVVDDHVARARTGLEARFPSYAAKAGQEDALFLIGRGRGIPRGRSEVAAHYAERLISWRSEHGHPTRGSAFALLNQVWEYFGGVQCWTIDVKGNYHEHTLAGVETVAYGHSWIWDTLTAKGRFWIGLSPVGAFSWVRGDADAIRALFTSVCPWKPAGTKREWLAVAVDGAAPFASVNPTADWEHWSKNVSGVQTATRYAGWRYWSLDPPVNNVYAGNTDSWPDQVPLLVSGMGTGGIDVAFSPVTLLSGAVHTDNLDRWVSPVQLIDDSEALV